MTVDQGKSKKIVNTTGGKHDPRFERPKKKATKLAVDSRFKGMFESEEFQAPVKVDKYGRKIEDRTAGKDLKRFYQLEDEDEKQEVEESCSSSEEDSLSESTSGSDDSDEEEPEMLVFEETLAQHPLVNQSVDLCEATRRLAIVNLDWDQIKAIDILHMLHGFKPVTGVIESVKIYPSEFGKERMAKEAVEGPPKDIFKEGESEGSGDDEDEDKSREPLKPLMVDEGQDFDEVQLRKYQLERLRYYYAVVTCDSRETASAIYKQCDGTEFEMSANFLDLRYIPEGVSFDEDVPTDVADHTQRGYKPKTDLVTPALQQSKVKLTWDMDDPDRARLTKIDFAKFDYNENDLKAYLASSSDDEEEESEDEGKMDYRALLLGGTSSDVFGRKSHEDNENLQITFTSGFGDHLNVDDVGSDDEDVHMEATFDLSDDDSNIPEEKEAKDETVFEAQLRKMRDKKKAKKEARLAKIQETKEAERAERKAEAKKAKKQRTGKADLDPEQSRRAAELDLLMLEDQPAAADGTKGKHFDMSEIIKSSKKKRKSDKSNVDPDEFKLDVQDDRFKAIFEEPSYAIDPTHSSFKATNAMRSLIDERQRRNKSRHK